MAGKKNSKTVAETGRKTTECEACGRQVATLIYEGEPVVVEPKPVRGYAVHLDDYGEEEGSIMVPEVYLAHKSFCRPKTDKDGDKDK